MYQVRLKYTKNTCTRAQGGFAKQNYAGVSRGRGYIYRTAVGFAKSTAQVKVFVPSTNFLKIRPFGGFAFRAAYKEPR